MSYQNYNIDLLHLQDKSFNIINVEKQIINGVETLIIEVKKNTNELFCIHCGSTYIVTKDYYVRTIKYLDIAGYNSIIKYKQKRYKCKDCKLTFNEGNSFVKKHSTISNQTKLKLLEECRIKQSFTDVGKRLNLSTTTTVLNEFKDHVSISRNKL